MSLRREGRGPKESVRWSGEEVVERVEGIPPRQRNPGWVKESFPCSLSVLERVEC